MKEISVQQSNIAAVTECFRLAADAVRRFLFVDPRFENNVILTGSEFLTMNTRPKIPANARNLNACVIGSSGSGKTRFWLTPQLLQGNCGHTVAIFTFRPSGQNAKICLLGSLPKPGFGPTWPEESASLRSLFSHPLTLLFLLPARLRIA